MSNFKKESENSLLAINFLLIKYFIYEILLCETKKLKLCVNLLFQTYQQQQQPRNKKESYLYSWSQFVEKIVYSFVHRMVSSLCEFLS